ncbi:IS200/IS605 family accessory protein TnpB-related protein [Streptomyces sp. R28]|uniref:IS200/IS605 family accessory protein TnpB-related protein n=1 Tax=Streptomyces sp. R28 TaxID=3238628 RepID=A0AB39PSX9_9ACTN
MGGLRTLTAPFVVPGPAGVSIRARLRVSDTDTAVLREVGLFLGSLAAGDLAERCRQGLTHGTASWSQRKRELTRRSSSRWAGSITKATHDQWALARRGQVAHMTWLRGQIAQIEAKLARPLGAKADKQTGLPRGYATQQEWHTKCRRLRMLQNRLAPVEADWAAGRVRVVRGGKHLARTRHHLDQAGLTKQVWRERWEAARMFLAADGESGKPWGNESIRATDTGQLSLKLPRDAQLRHALTQLLHYTRRRGAAAIAIEDLDFADAKSREKHGRNKRFRRLLSRFPTARLRARLVAMAAEQGLRIVAIDPAYTSRWGAQHWQQPLTTPTRKTTRHDAAAVAIGRRALGHPIRRRTAPPPHDQRDRAGHRTAQAGPDTWRREGTRPRIPGPRTGSVPPGCGAKAGDQRAQHRSGHAAEHASWHQDALPLSL